MNKSHNLQDMYLNVTKKTGTPVTMFLMNGFQIRGVVTGFDNFVVAVESEGKQQMIYKHAISTIVPSKPLIFGQETA